MQFEEKTIERKEIYQGPIFQVVTDQVELPDGKGQAQRDLIFHNGAVAVLPITDEGKTILVKQYRKAIERTSVEIPAGKLEKGENADPQAAALRELEEEIGVEFQDEELLKISTVQDLLDLIDQGVDFDKAHFLSMQQDLKKQIDLLKGL